MGKKKGNRETDRLSQVIKSPRLIHDEWFRGRRNERQADEDQENNRGDDFTEKTVMNLDSLHTIHAKFSWDGSTNIVFSTATNCNLSLSLFGSSVPGAFPNERRPEATTVTKALLGPPEHISGAPVSASSCSPLIQSQAVVGRGNDAVSH